MFSAFWWRWKRKYKKNSESINPFPFGTHTQVSLTCRNQQVREVTISPHGVIVLRFVTRCIIIRIYEVSSCFSHHHTF